MNIKCKTLGDYSKSLGVRVFTTRARVLLLYSYLMTIFSSAFFLNLLLLEVTFGNIHAPIKLQTKLQNEGFNLSDVFMDKNIKDVYPQLVDLYCTENVILLDFLQFDAII